MGSELCISVRLRFHFLESAELSYLPICFPKVADFVAVATSLTLVTLTAGRLQMTLHVSMTSKYDTKGHERSWLSLSASQVASFPRPVTHSGVTYSGSATLAISMGQVQQMDQRPLLAGENKAGMCRCKPRVPTRCPLSMFTSFQNTWGPCRT